MRGVHRGANAIGVALALALLGCSKSDPATSIPAGVATVETPPEDLPAQDAVPKEQAAASEEDAAGEIVQPAPAPTDFETLREESPLIDRALRLKASTENANVADLQLLFAKVQDHIRPLDTPARQQLRKQVASRIESDASRLRELQAYFVEGPGRIRWWDHLELRRVITQLLGAQGEAVGIYQDAKALLLRPIAFNPLNPEIPDLYIEPHLSAGLKTLLIYTLVVSQGHSNVGETTLCEELRLLYPVDVAQNLPRKYLSDHLLLDESTESAYFMIPNAGFVMGGALCDGEYRGLDCSAFVSHCTQSSERMTTWVLEFCYRELTDGLDGFDSVELEVRGEFLAKWGLQDALQDFEAVEVENANDLEPGDVFVRRWTDQKSGQRVGNSSLFLKTQEDGTVWVVECNRVYDSESGERTEGIILRSYDLHVPKVEVYVLRPVATENRR